MHFAIFVAIAPSDTSGEAIILLPTAAFLLTFQQSDDCLFG